MGAGVRCVQLECGQKAQPGCRSQHHLEYLQSCSTRPLAPVCNSGCVTLCFCLLFFGVCCPDRCTLHPQDMEIAVTKALEQSV